MIELVFVIVVLGVIAGIAIPKFILSRDDAIIARTKTQIAAIRAAISAKYNERLLAGIPSYPSSLEPENSKMLFSSLLPQNPSKESAGDEGWSKSGVRYTYRYKNFIATFEYNAQKGTFACVDGNICSEL